MIRMIILMILVLIVFVLPCHSDVVILENGERMEGHIYKVDRDRKIIEFEVVESGQLVGFIMKLSKSEMIYIKQDGKYNDLVLGRKRKADEMRQAEEEAQAKRFDVYKRELDDFEVEYRIQVLLENIKSSITPDIFVYEL